MKPKRESFLARAATMLLVTVLMAMLWMPTAVQAQTRDVITFTGGHADPNNPSVYIIDGGDFDMDSGEPPIVTVTLSRPLGATATRPASITLNVEGRADNGGETVTFQPGETTKTVELSAINDEMCTYSGNQPAVYGVLRTNHADAAYEALVINVNCTATEEPETCTYSTSQELLMEYLRDNPYNYRQVFCFHYGNYVLLKFYLNTAFKVTADSRMVLKTRYTDHTGLATNADDYGMSKTREVVLTPLNVGAVTRAVWYLYKPQDDEMLYSYVFDGEYTEIDNTRTGAEAIKHVVYFVSELGPFEVAKPADGGLQQIFFSRADVGETFAYDVSVTAKEFYPKFSNIGINKTSFKSGETMVITATMDNWHLMKRARQTEFISAFGVTLDDGQTTEPYRFDFDEATGVVTYYVTAPTVDQETAIQVDFGPNAECLIWDEESWFPYEIYRIVTGSEGMFSVTVSPESAPEVSATSIAFVNMPADGSDIYLERDYNDILPKEFPLGITTVPANATDAGTVTYTVDNEGGAGASIDTNDGTAIFNTGAFTGTVTLTATLASGVSTSRTYHLTTSAARPVHYANTYLAGTSFPKFQFKLDCFAQLDNTWDWTPVGDDVTVNYTHANGTKWTEHYKFSTLPRTMGEYLKDFGSFMGRFDESHIWRTYELPFVFTTDHPDATPEQIGTTLVTAEVLLTMENASGNRLQVVSTATLEPSMKALSFKGYSRLEEHYHLKSEPTITSDVMYLPRQGFIVGYEIPELGLSGTYNDQTDGDNVPEWLELQEDGIYTTAAIKVHPDLNRLQTYDLTMYTLAQRTCFPDEAMERSLTSNVTFSPISAEDNIVYRVNGENVTGDLTFDNGTAVANFINRLKADGFVNDADADVESMFNQTKAYFTIYDKAFEGAEVTLTREGDDEPLQTLTHYKGCFMFMPPADGRTYIIDVYYPAFDKHYTNTFVSHQMTGAKKVNLFMDGDYYSSKDYVFTFTNSENEYDIPFSQLLKGYIYADGADAFFLSKENSEFKPRIQFPEEFHPLIYNNTPELKTVKELYSSWEAESGYADEYYSKQLLNHYGTVTAGWNRWLRLHWNNMIRNTTLVTLLNSWGRPVKNATLNYACVDKDMGNPTSMGTATYSEELGGYNIATDPGKYAELIEVVLPGHQHPVLNMMNLWSYNYRSVANVRNHTIVLSDLDKVMSDAKLETLELTDGYSKYKYYMTAKPTTTNLLSNGNLGFLQYSETADYPTLHKLLWDERFGDTQSRAFLKYARVTVSLHSDDIQSLDDIKLKLNGFIKVEGGSRNFQEYLSPDEAYTKFIDKNVITSFSSNHCLLDFDITEKIPVNAYAYLNLQKGGKDTWDWGHLRTLENKSVDMVELEKESQFNEGIKGYNLTELDDDIDASTGKNTTKDTDKMFNNFKFSTPPTLPFTMNIERKDDYFIVRGIYEQNMIPNSQLMDLMDAAAYAEWFSDQFNECMNAVKNTPDVTEDRIRELRKAPSAFLGIKGYISGVGRLTDNGQLEVNFNDGGIIMEGSGSIMGKVSFGGIANFGARLSAGVAARMGVQNAKGAKPLIDIISEAQFWLNVGAWMEIGVNLWDIAEAKCGIVGTAGIDIRAGNVVPTYHGDACSGSMVKFDFDLTAYMKARFLCFKVGQNFTLLKGEKTFYKPEDITNPYYEGCPHPMMDLSRQNITNSYQKLSRKTRRALSGTSLFDNVSGMAQPTYLLGGNSLLFNNLKTASNYNDDRLQLYTGSGKPDDLVSTGIEAPMYGFDEAHNENGLEVVAFEQLNNAINGETLESYDMTGQQKIVSEMSEIYATWRNNGGSWQTQKIGSMDASACVKPAVAVTKENLHKAHAAVIWQQGKAMFNDEGNRYIEGSLMLSLFNGTSWSDPMEIMRINRRNVPVDYKMSIKTLSPDGGGIDEVLVAMTLKQDINNPLEPTKLVYLNVAPEGYEYKVRTRYTNVEANMLQMERVLDTNSTTSFDNGESYITDGANLVAYMEYTENGPDLKLTSVDMKGEPTGKLNGNIGMVGRMVNDYRLVVDDKARDLSNVALLWNQSDEERTDNGDGTAKVTFKNRIYASKLCSQDKQIYFSSPIAVTDIESANELMTLASMDGYLDGLDMKVAYCASNESDAAAVREVEVTFENDIDTKISFNPYKVNDLQEIPVTITVENKGYEPIDRLDVTMNGETTSHFVTVLPMEKTELKTIYAATDTFDGTIDYNVAANFVIANSNALKSRRKGAAGAPHRIEQSGQQLNVRQVDMILNMLSIADGEDGKTTIVAEVNNASQLPLADDMSVKVGLYTSPLVDNNSVSIAEVTLPASDLYDAANRQNKVKIVDLTATQPDYDQTFYLNTTVMQNGEALKDVKPLNNLQPVTIKGKYLLGDVNCDGLVNMGDVAAVCAIIAGNTADNGHADVNGDGTIGVGDIIAITKIITSNVSASRKATR